jgi:dipeptidyl aminopeptidase/acylaminoacyl peptidase
LDLIESVKQLPWVDKNRIGMWAHSNGGQIALSVLEITGAVYPTVLWAPMTLAFPQSVLGTAETPEIRQVIEKFEQYYDARRYAFENYLEWIKAPILILQGDRDEWVKVEWQEKLVRQLADLGKEAELVVYSGSDHNLSHPPAGGWDRAAERTRKWYWSKRLIQ